MSTNDDTNALYFDVQQKTDKQHILDNPDTYIGSVETVDTDMWIMNEASDKIVEKTIRYVPGLFKLFDEGIVNCRDHVIRMQSKVDASVPNSLPVTYIDIAIQEDGTIIMINDGNGIDVVQHPEYKTWVPELIFGHLRTSTNYNKEEKKIVGGKNGFGFKLVLIWSTQGSIETVDHIRGLKYVQDFNNNLDTICPPKILVISAISLFSKTFFMGSPLTFINLPLRGYTPIMFLSSDDRPDMIPVFAESPSQKIIMQCLDLSVPAQFASSNFGMPRIVLLFVPSTFFTALSSFT